MAQISDSLGIRQFVLDTLRLAGAAYSEPDQDLILASCQVTRPGGIFTGPQVVREEMQLVFTPEGTERHPSAELVCPGSFRLQWFIAGLRTRGLLTRQYYGEDLSSRRVEKEILSLLPTSAPRFAFRSQRRRFLPFLFAVMRLTATAGEKHEELLALAVSLTDGSLRPGLAERIRGMAFLPGLEFQRVERRRLSWREAWRLIQEQAMHRALSYGKDWYQAALARLANEGEQLRQFYAEMLKEAEDGVAVRGEYLRRLAELSEKYAPAIRISLANAALLYLPQIVHLVDDAAGRPLPPIYYEPASGLVAWDCLKT